MLSIKPNAVIEGLKPEILLGLMVVERIFGSHGFNTVVTELMGGKHSEGSLHYKGLAVDIRSKHIAQEHLKLTLLEDAARALGPAYDLILEAPGTDNEHYHLEFQPKGWP